MTLSASIMYLYVLCLVTGLTASIKVMKIVDSVPSCSGLSDDFNFGMKNAA